MCRSCIAFIYIVRRAEFNAQPRYNITEKKSLSNKSFSHAAVKLHMKQPAISKNILSMEQVLGVKILTRSVRPIEATKEGSQLYAKWKNLLEEYEDSLA